MSTYQGRRRVRYANNLRTMTRHDLEIFSNPSAFTITLNSSNTQHWTDQKPPWTCSRSQHRFVISNPASMYWIMSFMVITLDFCCTNFLIYETTYSFEVPQHKVTTLFYYYVVLCQLLCFLWVGKVKHNMAQSVTDGNMYKNKIHWRRLFCIPYRGVRVYYSIHYFAVSFFHHFV